MSAALSYLPSWLVTFGSGGIALLGVGLLVYSILPLCNLPRVAAGGGIMCLGAACFLAGVGSAQAVCEVSALRAEIAAKDAAIEARDAAIQAQNENIRRVQALNSHLSDLSAQADDQAEDMRHAVLQLEEDLRAARADAGCRFSDDEYRRVRELIERAQRPARDGARR